MSFWEKFQERELVKTAGLVVGEIILIRATATQ